MFGFFLFVFTKMTYLVMLFFYLFKIIYFLLVFYIEYSKENAFHNE